MVKIMDCKGRLTCMGDASTGFVETVYKGQRTRATLSVGDKFTIECQGVVTDIIRASTTAFKVESHECAA